MCLNKISIFTNIETCWCWQHTICASLIDAINFNRPYSANQKDVFVTETGSKSKLESAEMNTQESGRGLTIPAEVFLPCFKWLKFELGAGPEGCQEIRNCPCCFPICYSDFMTPCKFKTVKHKAWTMADWDAEVLASSVENCRCEQLCKCPSQDYTNNLVNLAMGHCVGFRLWLCNES